MAFLLQGVTPAVLGAGMPAAAAAVGGVRRFVDISVPRNIAANVNELEGAARVFNVDDLKEVRHEGSHTPMHELNHGGMVFATFFCVMPGT